jgi:hypothetical protein
MKKIKFKSNLINALPNIQGLDQLRDILFQQQFHHGKDNFFRTAEKKYKLTQKIFLKENLNLNRILDQIQKNNLQGFILPTNLLGEALLNAPLPLSAQKQSLIQTFSQMNNGKANEAEGVNLLYSLSNQDQSFSQKQFPSLAPNFCSQLISNIHYNQKSRLTLGESHLENPKTHLPYGQAILQISHLTHHALDLDLSIKISPDNSPTSNYLVHEYCFSIPYSLNNKTYSDHGYILHLSGSDITPEKIVQIVGLRKSAFAGVTISTGKSKSILLNHKKQKKIFRKESITFFNQKNEQSISESIGTFIFDPEIKQLQKGLFISEKAGQIQSLDGEVTIVLFPLIQSFTAEYAKNKPSK